MPKSKGKRRTYQAPPRKKRKKKRNKLAIPALVVGVAVLGTGAVLGAKQIQSNNLQATARQDSLSRATLAASKGHVFLSGLPDSARMDIGGRRFKNGDPLDPGDILINVSAPNYQSSQIPVTVVAGKTDTIPVNMTVASATGPAIGAPTGPTGAGQGNRPTSPTGPAPAAGPTGSNSVGISVVDQRGTFLAGATILIDRTTSGAGRTLKTLNVGQHVIGAASPGCQAADSTLTVQLGAQQTLKIALQCP